MRTWTETHREGELLGPVDLTYDFLQHFQGLCSTDQVKQEFCAKAVERLKEISQGGDWYHEGFKIVHVGMYDGWPYWKPTPAFSYIGPLGSLEWAFFYELAWHKPIQKQPAPAAT